MRFFLRLCCFIFGLFSLTAAADVFGTLQRDQRKCPSPLCGGYWFTPVNGAGKTFYVSGLIASSSQEGFYLPDAQLSSLLVQGHRGPVRPDFHTSALIVDAVYARVGEEAPDLTLTFSSVSQRIPPHLCVVAPCPNLLAAALNLNRVKEFDRFDFQGFAPSLTEATLVKMALNPRIITLGRFVPGQEFPGGFETVYEVIALYRPWKASARTGTDLFPASDDAG